MSSLLARTPLSVDERTTITPDVFRREYVDRHRPLILRGAVSHWPAMQWDDASLIRKLMAYPLRVDIIPHDSAGRLLLSQTRRESMTAESLVGCFSSSDAHYYVHDLNLPLPLHGDLGTHDVSSVFPVPRRKTWWWGTERQISSLHYDDNENFMCQFSGQKEFLLFDITDFWSLDPQQDPEYVSAIDLDRASSKDHPRFRDATPYLARIEAGDLLYVPCYWWHRVTSHGRHLAVSYIINETMEQRVRVAGRLIEHGVLSLDATDRDALLAIVGSDERPSRRNAQLRAYHCNYVTKHGQSYYPHPIFHRLIEESLIQILRGHATY